MSEDRKFDEYLEHRAEQLGLPTDPEAYRSGGLVAIITTYNLQHADLIACQLRGAGIPAWVDGQYMAALYWHAFCGLHPKGIRVLVPDSCMADARAVLENPRDWDPQAVLDTEPPPAELHQHLLRRARALALLTLLTCLAPLLACLAFHLAVQVRREARRGGETPELKKAQRWALAVLAINGTILFLFAAWGGAIGLKSM